MWHCFSVEETSKKLRTNIDQGLRNRRSPKKKRKIWRKQIRRAKKGKPTKAIYQTI